MVSLFGAKKDKPPSRALSFCILLALLYVGQNDLLIGQPYEANLKCICPKFVIYELA